MRLNDKKEKNKVLYVITIIALALAVCAGIVTIIGFIVQQAIMQIVGIVVLIVSYLTSLIIDWVMNREEKRKE